MDGIIPAERSPDQPLPPLGQPGPSHRRGLASASDGKTEERQRATFLVRGGSHRLASLLMLVHPPRPFYDIPTRLVQDLSLPGQDSLGSGEPTATWMNPREETWPLERATMSSPIAAKQEQRVAQQSKAAHRQRQRVQLTAPSGSLKLQYDTKFTGVIHRPLSRRALCPWPTSPCVTKTRTPALTDIPVCSISRHPYMAPRFAAKARVPTTGPGFRASASGRCRWPCAPASSGRPPGRGGGPRPGPG